MEEAKEDILILPACLRRALRPLGSSGHLDASKTSVEVIYLQIELKDSNLVPFAVDWRCVFVDR